jgi:hypothetical protein
LSGSKNRAAITALAAAEWKTFKPTVSILVYLHGARQRGLRYLRKHARSLTSVGRLPIPLSNLGRVTEVTFPPHPPSLQPPPTTPL